MTRGPARVLAAAAVVGLFFLYFFGLTRTGLLGPDEPRYAAIGRAMAADRRLDHAASVGRAVVRKARAAVLDDGGGFQGRARSGLRPGCRWRSRASRS